MQRGVREGGVSAVGAKTFRKEVPKRVGEHRTKGGRKETIRPESL